MGWLRWLEWPSVGSDQRASSGENVGDREGAEIGLDRVGWTTRAEMSRRAKGLSRPRFKK